MPDGPTCVHDAPHPAFQRGSGVSCTSTVDHAPHLAFQRGRACRARLPWTTRHTRPRRGGVARGPHGSAARVRTGGLGPTPHPHRPMDAAAGGQKSSTPRLVNLATTVSRFDSITTCVTSSPPRVSASSSTTAGMGATLEQFDLSLENDYRLPGRCHEALVLNRPDVIEGVHSSMLDAGAEVVETDTFQASRLKLSEWGLEDHTLEINLEGGADRAQGGRRASLRRRLDRPDRLPARQRRPDARPDHVPRARRGLHRAGPRRSSRAAPT